MATSNDFAQGLAAATLRNIFLRSSGGSLARDKVEDIDGMYTFA
jgi:hypothetical protein